MIIGLLFTTGFVALIVIAIKKHGEKQAELSRLRFEERKEKRRKLEEKVKKYKEQVEKYGLEELEVDNLILNSSEICYYMNTVDFMKVLKTKNDVYTGTLYLTNEQFIFNSTSSKLSKNIKDISYIDTKNIEKGVLSIQIGKSWYEIRLEEPEILEIVMREVIQQYKSNNPKYSRRLICEYCNTENVIDSRTKQIKCSNCGGPLKRKELK